MSTCLVPRLGGIALGALVALVSSACVDSFGGAFIQLTLDQSVEGPPEPGGTPSGAQPPPDTFFSIYAVRYEFATCEACPTGTTCDTAVDLCLDDDTGEPATADSFAFRVVDFEVKPVIDLSSPCFIEHQERPFPGLHSTREVNRYGVEFGIPIDITGEPQIPTDQNEFEATTILTAVARRGFLSPTQAEVQAVTSFSNALGTRDVALQVATECVEDNPNVDPNLIPPPDCLGDDSNARRLTLCEAYWAANPTYYEGSDLVFTLPLNGAFRGMVSGTNPKNGVSNFDGAGFFVETAMDDFDAFLIQWQYKDLDGDGLPDYPASLPQQERSQIGFHYLEGTPETITRGVRSVPLSNRTFSVNGDAAVFPNIGEDDIQF